MLERNFRGRHPMNRVQVTQCVRQSLEIFRPQLDANIDILRHERATMNCRGQSTDENEFDFRLGQTAQQANEITHALERSGGRPATRQRRRPHGLRPRGVRTQ